MSEALVTRPMTVTNQQISDALHEVADLLQVQGANGFRVGAYRIAADTVPQLKVTASEILDSEGTAGLMKLQGVGRGLANHIKQLIDTGHLPLLDRLRGDYRAERMFATVPDIGPELAHRIHEHLHVENLFELKAAADDGRLAAVPGMGPKRVRAVRECLAGRLSGLTPATEAETSVFVSSDVPVSEILDVDAEYRRLAAAGKLPLIAPRQFNPTGIAWLPILHTQRGEHHYTALYSNTVRAHQMGTTHDWVVVYRDDDVDHGRWTVITAQYRKLRGKRIIPGRELECARHYSQVSLKSQPENCV
jgi:hypothetical protein